MQTPQQIISESIKEICEKSRIGKKIFSTIVENIKQLNNLTEEQQKIVDEMQELVVEGTIKKNVVERLKILNQDFQDKIINMVIVQQYTHIVGEVEKTNIIKIFDIEAGYEFSETKPMKGVSYETIKNRYTTSIDNKVIHSKELSVICETKMNDIMNKLRHKYKHNIVLDKIDVCNVFSEIISFKYHDIELFDIKHILSYIHLCKRSIRRVMHVIHKEQLYFVNIKNEFGGYQIRTLIDLEVLKKILNYSNKIQSRKLAEIIGINVCDIFLSTKEQTYIGIISDVFKNENKTDQFSIHHYRIDLYFINYELAIECDENGHLSRNKDYEKKRQKYVESHNISFIRFNPDEKNFNIYEIIGNIHTFMIKYIIDKK
jgi:very-short-patch-repair endonuclease